MTAKTKSGNAYKQRKIKGRRMTEHQVVMENTLGRRLRVGEVVHHINGDPRNNCPENLEVLN